MPGGRLLCRLLDAHEFAAADLARRGVPDKYGELRLPETQQYSTFPARDRRGRFRPAGGQQ
jgi:hypothetical protein